MPVSSTVIATVSAPTSAGGEGDRAARRGELVRVGEQIEEHLAQPVAVGDHRRQIIRQRDREALPLARHHRGEHPLDRQHFRPERDSGAVERLLARLDARDIEDIVHHHQQMVAALQDVLIREFPLLFRWG